uniref:Transposase Tc1-like domain-containing protein n=1 Tax=Plectus sambesii TaxID=2011161 RepID=A0A914VHP1_9BILA
MSKDDFLIWKVELQKRTNAQFVRHTVVGRTGTKNYYYNRAGEDQVRQKTDKEKENSRAQRASRNKGSVRSGVNCPASISFKHIPDSTVNATSFLKHIGHDKDVCCVNPSTPTREIIKTKLREGFAPDRIAEFFRRVHVDDSTIRRRLIEGELFGRVAAKKPFISEKSRKARLQFTKRHVNWTLADWAKVLWSDESKFCLFGSNGRQHPIGKRDDHRY